MATSDRDVGWLGLEAAALHRAERYYLCTLVAGEELAERRVGAGRCRSWTRCGPFGVNGWRLGRQI